MTTLAVGEQGFIPVPDGNEQRTLRQAAMAVAPGSGGTGTGTINPIAMTMADPEGGGGIGSAQLTTLADPEGGGAIGGGNFGPTTMAVGEEGGGFKPPNLETRAIPENGGGIGSGIINTTAVGEQGGSILNPGGGGGGMPPLYMPGGMPPAMTMAFPESGGGIGGGMMPTFGPANSEMGRPPMSVTQAVGEDGRFPPPMSGGSPSIPGQNPFDFSTFKTDLLTGIGDLFKKYFDETSSPFGGNEITPPPAPGETTPTMSPGDLVAPSSNYGSLASKGMQSPFRGL